jgi:prophage regulatory protein
MMSATASPAAPSRFIRLRVLLTRVPLSRTRIYELVERGSFPAPIKLSERASAWDEAEVEQWMAERRAQSRKAAA